MRTSVDIGGRVSGRGPHYHQATGGTQSQDEKTAKRQEKEENEEVVFLTQAGCNAYTSVDTTELDWTLCALFYNSKY